MIGDENLKEPYKLGIYGNLNLGYDVSGTDYIMFLGENA